MVSATDSAVAELGAAAAKGAEDSGENDGENDECNDDESAQSHALLGRQSMSVTQIRRYSVAGLVPPR